MQETLWDSAQTTLSSQQGLIKVLILFATARIWWPILRRMWTEVEHVLAPGGGLYGLKKRRPIPTRTLADDPFVNIPLASYRAQRERGATSNTESSQREIVPARRRVSRSRGHAGQSTTRSTAKRGF